MDVRDKVAVVTGGARGIGHGIALALARAGAHVAVADLYTPGQTTAGYALSTEQEVVQTVEELKATGVPAIGVPVDVTKFTQLQVMVETVTRELGPIDILCNNAGVIDTALVVDTTEAQWDMMMNVNAKGVFLGCKAVVPGMMTRRQGRIINTASIAGKRGNARVSAYCASKFAVIGFTQALALETAADGIRVNAVCPGYVRTSMQEREVVWEADLRGITPEEVRQDYLRAIPLGRLEEPEDVARVVVFLLSDRAAYMTGQAINVTGGSIMF